MRTKRTVLAVGSCALVVGAIAAVAATRESAHATQVIERSSITPTIDQVRYRFSIATSAELDPLAMIPDLEARVSVHATPFDTAELADLYLRRATLSGDPADFTRAESTAKKSLALLPSPNGAPLTLARVATARHEFRTAIDLARGYLAHSSSAGAYTILTTSYLALGELPAAAESAETQVSIKPSSGAYLMRALVYAAQGRDAEAAYDFARAVVVEDFGDPREGARLRTLWGRFLLRRGDTTGARMLFDEALRIAPDHALATAHRAELALRMGHTRDARAGFSRAFEASREVRFLIDEARARELSGDLAGATSTRTQVEKLVRAELSSSGTGHTLDLVEILVDRGSPSDLAEAITLGTAEVSRRPSADVRFQLARAYHRAARPREALGQIRAALATGARDARIYELAGRLEAAMGNAPRAEMYRREASLLDPGNGAWRYLGMAVAQ
jgi:tetratricopeptide (TPR) repeat protein